MSHERLDGEIIAIDTRNGSYYSLCGPAADCWTLIAGEFSTEEWRRLLSQAFDTKELEGLNEFIQSCINFDLIEETTNQQIEAQANKPKSALLDDYLRTAWSRPEIIHFDDLQDLIKIDPIHDTSSFGWPVAESND